MDTSANMTHRLFEHNDKQLTVSEMEIVRDGCVTVSISSVFDVTKHPMYFDTELSTRNKSKWCFYIVVGGVIIHPTKNNCSVIGFRSKEMAWEHHDKFLHALRTGTSVYQNKNNRCVVLRNADSTSGYGPMLFDSVWDSMEHAYEHIANIHGLGGLCKQELHYNRNIYGDTFVSNSFGGMYSLVLTSVKTDSNDVRDHTILSI